MQCQEMQEHSMPGTYRTHTHTHTPSFQGGLLTCSWSLFAYSWTFLLCLQSVEVLRHAFPLYAKTLQLQVKKLPNTPVSKNAPKHNCKQDSSTVSRKLLIVSKEGASAPLPTSLVSSTVSSEKVPSVPKRLHFSTLFWEN